MSGARAAIPALLLLLAGAAAGAVSSTELIERAAELDGQAVELTGEAIGEPMRRGAHLWLNVSDGANAIGVWVPAARLPPIAYHGSYRARGDTLLVHGTFHRSCPRHGGDLDLHAVEITVLAAGAPSGRPVTGGSVLLAAGLLASSLASFGLWRRRERARRG